MALLDFDPQILALLVFLLTYLFIASGRRERTIAAIGGAAVLYTLGILSTPEMIGYVDLNALGLLFGMMVIVGALREANFFRWLGVHLSNFCNCRPVPIFFLFTFVTAILSAFLDNVTTVLFMVAVTIDITDMLKLDPKPFIIGEIIASNIGGAATLIGDPPGIIVAAATGFTFMDFIFNVAPLVIVLLPIAILIIYFFYRKKIRSDVKITTMPITPSEIITNRRLFNIGTVVLLITVVLFTIHDKLHVSPSTIAILAATVLLFVGGPRMPEILGDVEWRTLIFLSCLFVIVGGLEKTGFISLLSEQALPYLTINASIAASIILWLASLASAFLDNVPFVAAFIPFLMGVEPPGGAGDVLWWALLLGAGLGGNGTPLGASANVVALGIAYKSGIKISFREFVSLGLKVTLITTAIGNLLILVMFTL